MNKEIFTGLKARIETAQSIKHVGLYNSQFTNEAIEKPFKYPAVFIEFSDISFRSENQGIKKIDLTTTLHVGIRQLVEDVVLFDIVDEVSKVVDRWEMDNTTPFLKIQEFHDTDHDNVLVWRISFVCTVTDENSSRFNDLTTTTPTLLEINRSLDIDNLIIRSGDGN